jgi:hypothetical protein
MYCDSNVLVVVRALDDEVRLRVAKAALEVNEKYRATLSRFAGEGLYHREV